MFAALTVLLVAVGLGHSPERGFATPLMLIFPFAGLTAVVLVRFANSLPKIFVAVAVLGSAGIITLNWDAIIATPGYGVQGPCNTRSTFATETALKLRELWRVGKLGPQEKILIEIGEPGATGAWRFEQYPLRAFSDHPLHFTRERRGELTRKLDYLVPFMREKGIRVAIILSDENREKVRWYYFDICDDAVVYENPTQTIVVLREGWDEVPDFAAITCRDEVVVYDLLYEDG
jgi:hypothetical protein